MVFQALLEKYTKNINSCIIKLVIQSETQGEPAWFSLVKALGKVPALAAANGSSAVTMVQASQLVKTDTTNPMFIIQAPHLPKIGSKIPAVEGLATCASCS